VEVRQHLRGSLDSAKGWAEVPLVYLWYLAVTHAFRVFRPATCLTAAYTTTT